MENLAKGLVILGVLRFLGCVASSFLGVERSESDQEDEEIRIGIEIRFVGINV